MIWRCLPRVSSISLSLQGVFTLSRSRPGAQLGKDSQGLFQIVCSPHALQKSAKGQAVCLVIFVGRLVIDIKMLEQRQSFIETALVCKALAFGHQQALVMLHARFKGVDESNTVVNFVQLEQGPALLLAAQDTEGGMCTVFIQQHFSGIQSMPRIGAQQS